ncbi:hypothetical protein [Mucilaginibacter sp. PAMB04168]|uniref:hypothetical protein n=1 Tax=Mucilaginibacter sp. PAMB04168 TaxID=3138567 RepID=UPI0031F6D4AF
MSLKNFKLMKLEYATVCMIALICILFSGCQKNKFDVPVNTATIRFSESAYTIERNALEPLTVRLPLSLPLEEDATAVITVDNSSTADASEYVVTPSLAATGIEMKLAKGATEATFQVASADNFEGDRTLVFKITSAKGGVIVSSTNASAVINIKGKPIILPSIGTSVTDLPSFGNVITTTASASSMYTVSGVKLSADVTITASANFQVSLNNITFTNTVSIPFATANASPVPVYARFVPNTGSNQGISGTITHSSGTLPDVVVNVIGVEYGNAAAGVLIMKDDFEYGSTAGNLKDLSSGNWTLFSGTVNPARYITAGLTFPGYVGSGKGGAVISENGAGSREDYSRSFTAQSDGVLYTSQLVNFASSPAAGDFYTSWRDPAAAYFNRIYVKDNGGKLNLGIAKSSATTSYSTTAYEYGQTYLLVTKYDFASGISSLYILSSAPPLIEPAVADATTNVGAGPASLINIIIRQNTGVLTTTMDGIRVATSWKQAVGL